MIKINLLGEVRTVDHTQTLMILGFVASLVVTFAVCFIVDNSLSNYLVSVKEDNELLELQLKKLKEQTKSVALLEKKKQDLTDKLRIIALLKRSKTGPVRVLDDLNLAIPDRSWLSAMKESEGVLHITGFALDNQTIATFMKDLAHSDYFESVDLEEAKSAQKDGAKIRSFGLNAKVNYAGKVKPTPTPSLSAALSSAGASSAGVPASTGAISAASAAAPPVAGEDKE